MLEKLNGKHHINVLIYGYYSHENIGDDLFEEAFKELLPSNCLINFVDILSTLDLNEADVIIFGGGSFLYAKPNISNNDLEILKKKTILYIGIGVEDYIHPIHIELMHLAKLIAIRSTEQYKRVLELNSNTIVIPDIVYSLQNSVFKSDKISQSVLVIPNILVVPKWNDPNWQHAAWNYFKSEFSQFLDVLVKDNYKLNFFAMSENAKENDKHVAAELINNMSCRNSYNIERVEGLSNITKLISKYDVIITQRYHGIVLAEMTSVPYIAIHHHDKIKNACPNNGSFLSYYGITKDNLLKQFNYIKDKKYSSDMLIESNIFEQLKHNVISLLG